MFFWIRKKSNVNKIELERVIFHKIGKMNSLCNDFYCFNKPRKKKYGVHTVIKNVPVSINEGNIVARVRYTGIPDTVVYFVLNISNIQKEYISSSNTVDVIINAKINGEECKDYRFELTPVLRRALTCM